MMVIASAASRLGQHLHRMATAVPHRRSCINKRNINYMNSTCRTVEEFNKGEHREIRWGPRKAAGWVLRSGGAKYSAWTGGRLMPSFCMRERRMLGLSLAAHRYSIPFWPPPSESWRLYCPGSARTKLRPVPVITAPDSQGDFMGLAITSRGYPVDSARITRAT